MVELACMIMPEGPVGAVVAAAQEAERLGCRRVWIPDEGLAARECYVTLAAVAAGTKRIELGTGITNAYTRHPGVTAAAIATLDELSDGRASLGIGAGGGLTLSPMAIERVSPLRAIRELTETSRALWAGEQVEHDGVAGRFAQARLGYGRADIPIWIAGRGPKVMALGGEVADGFILSYLHKELIGHHVEAITAAAIKHGRPRPRLCYMTALVTTDEAFEATRRGLTFRLVDSPAEVKERIGMSPDDTEKLRAAIADGGLSAAAQYVRPEWVSQFAIVGTVDECRTELHSLMEQNQLDEFQVSVTDPSSADTLALAVDVATTA